MKNFLEELQDLINIHSKENASNTPDFILAQYLENCLEAFERATQQRETWYGRDMITETLEDDPEQYEGHPHHDCGDN
jgi:capsid portal protein